MLFYCKIYAANAKPRPTMTFDICIVVAALAGTIDAEGDAGLIPEGFTELLPEAAVSN